MRVLFFLIIGFCVVDFKRVINFGDKDYRDMLLFGSFYSFRIIGVEFSIDFGYVVMFVVVGNGDIRMCFNFFCRGNKFFYYI